MHTQDKQLPPAKKINENRKYCRGDVAIVAGIRALGGLKVHTRVIDLSTTGFRMECLTHFSNDQPLFLSLPGFEPLEAKIRWQTEWLYGCQFNKPLYPAVFEHIIKAHPALISQAAKTEGLVDGRDCIL